MALSFGSCVFTLFTFGCSMCFSVWWYCWTSMWDLSIMSWFHPFPLRRSMYENLLTYRISRSNYYRKEAQKDRFSSFLDPLPKTSLRRQGLYRSHLNGFLFGSMQKTSSLRLSASRNALGPSTDLLSRMLFWVKVVGRYRSWSHW